jgi:hypothetical protein
LPDDYDELFALAAPEDQRPAEPLQGGETIVVLNMTPEGALRFDLPKISLCFRTRFGRRTHDHGATLTTIFIATEAMKVSVVWQSALRIAPREVEYLDATTITEVPNLR